MAESVQAVSSAEQACPHGHCTAEGSRDPSVKWVFLEKPDIRAQGNPNKDLNRILRQLWRCTASSCFLGLLYSVSEGKFQSCYSAQIQLPVKEPGEAADGSKLSAIHVDGIPDSWLGLDLAWAGFQE